MTDSSMLIRDKLNQNAKLADELALKLAAATDGQDWRHVAGNLQQHFPQLTTTMIEYWEKKDPKDAAKELIKTYKSYKGSTVQYFVDAAHPNDEVIQLLLGAPDLLLQPTEVAYSKVFICIKVTSYTGICGCRVG